MSQLTAAYIKHTPETTKHTKFIVLTMLSISFEFAAVTAMASTAVDISLEFEAIDQDKTHPEKKIETIVENISTSLNKERSVSNIALLSGNGV